MEKKYKHIWFAKDRAVWRYEFQFKGMRYRDQGGFQTQREAGLAALDHKERIRIEYRMVGTIGTTLESISRRHLDALSKEENPINKDGRVNKARAVGTFLAFMGDFDLEIHKIMEADIKAYLETRPNNDSFNRYRTSLFQTFEYAIDVLKITNYNPVAKIKRKLVEHDERICPTAREVFLLIQTANDNFPSPTSKSKFKKIRSDERDLILMILYAMARPGEILKLKWEDISWGSRI